MSHTSVRNTYIAAAAIAVFVSLFQMWINLAVGIVGNEDNPANQGFFGVVLTAMACAFTASFAAKDMVRAMIATAGVQALLGFALYTAPSTGKDAKAVLVLTTVFVLAWLVSAALFRRSARLAG